MLKKSITILVCSFMAGWIYSVLVWISWDKPGGGIYGATVFPAILSTLILPFTIPVLAISAFLIVYGHKKSREKQVIVGTSIIGVFWFLMVVFANTGGFLD